MTYTELKKFLIKCSDSYYKESISLISDYDFDMKMKELEEMEKDQGFADPDSPTQQVGSDLINEDTSNKHTRPMLSLENTYNFDDVESWYNKMKESDKKAEIVVEYKVDGGSCAIRFNNGKIIKALTRGKGTEGEDITQNVSLLDFSSVKSNFSGEVRGELVITKDGFRKLNKDNEYQNARNLLSGSMKLLDPNEFKKRAPYIKFIAYWNENSKAKTHRDSLKELHDAGFIDSLYSTSVLVNNIDDLKSAINTIESNKQDIPYEIDGAVMKLNNRSLWNIIGSTSKYPRWAKAYKYKQEQANTIVEKIEYQVGRTGKITPVCYFTPIFLDGSTIEKATLNNKDFMDDLNIGVGCEISVQKAAAIIPQIVSIIDRTNMKHKAEFPTKCPICGTDLVKLDVDHADYFCTNDNCSARNINKLFHFTHMMEIDDFGDVVLEKIYSLGILNNIADIYDLKDHRDELIALDRLGEKSVDNMLENIEKSKSQKLEKLITGLGIKNIGLASAKALARKFKSLDNLMKSTKTELLMIDDIGEIVASSIIDYFSDLDNKNIISRLKASGVNMTDNSSLNNSLNGTIFVITGSLSQPRNYYVELIESLGGKVAGSVSSKTNYLINNDSTSNTSKNVKAKELNIPILTEDDLLKLIRR